MLPFDWSISARGPRTWPDLIGHSLLYARAQLITQLLLCIYGEYSVLVNIEVSNVATKTMSLDLFEQAESDREDDCELEDRQPDNGNDDSENESSGDESLNDMFVSLKRRKMSASRSSSCFTKKNKVLPAPLTTSEKRSVGKGTTFVRPKERLGSRSPATGNHKSTPSPLANVKAARSHSAPGRNSRATPRRDSSLLGHRILSSSHDSSRQKDLVRTNPMAKRDENQPPANPSPPHANSSSIGVDASTPPASLDDSEGTGDNIDNSNEYVHDRLPSDDASVSQALKDMTTVLNTLVKRVEDNASEIHALKTSLQSPVPSSSSESSSKSSKRKVPSIIRVC